MVPTLLCASLSTALRPSLTSGWARNRARGRPSRFLLEPLPAAPALLTSMDGGNAEDCREQFRPPSMAVGRIGSLGNCSCVALPPASLAVVPIATLPPSMAVGRIGSLPIATLPPSMAVVKPGRTNRQRSEQAGLIDKDDRQGRISGKPKADIFSCLSCLSCFSWTLRNLGYQ
jgi:hypothetical protein